MSRFRRKGVRRAHLAGDVLAETPTGGVVMKLDPDLKSADDGIVTVLVGSAVLPAEAAAELRRLAVELEP